MTNKVFDIANPYYGLLDDAQIIELCSGDRPMLSPFERTQKGKPSYGLGSFGYDLRLAEKFYRQITDDAGILDPCEDNSAEWYPCWENKHIIIGPGETILVGSFEAFDMPEDVMGLCFGKSSYARTGAIVNLTPVESSWRGKLLTIEISNLNLAHPIRLHVGQGIAQIVFFRGQTPLRGYGEKESGGAYQDQAGVCHDQAHAIKTSGKR